MKRNAIRMTAVTAALAGALALAGGGAAHAGTPDGAYTWSNGLGSTAPASLHHGVLAMGGQQMPVDVVRNGLIVHNSPWSVFRLAKQGRVYRGNSELLGVRTPVVITLAPR